MMITYTTTGPVRGDCGHRHRSIDTARTCLRRDGDGCASQGGYSDRRVVRWDGSELTAAEEAELLALDLADDAARWSV